MHRFAVSFRFGGFFAQSLAQPDIFSPTGRNATTRFELRSRTRGETVSWNLEIFDGSGNVVRSFGGKDLPPQQITWDGKDSTGLPLPDGMYRYELTVRDSEDMTLSSRARQIEILTDGPSGTVPVVIEESGK
jgi:flagellar hook assembly protein FlgD